MIEFFIPGIPVPYARSGGGKNTPRFTPAKQRNAMAAIKDYGLHAMKGCPPLDRALHVIIDATYPWPSSWSAKQRERNGRWKTSKPDSSNLQKLVEDALNGVVWTDDARIARTESTKRYGHQPGIRIVVEAL